MGAFSGGIENFGVLFGADFDDFGFFSYDLEAGHAEGAGVVHLTRYNGVVRNYGWLIEVFFAAFVGATEFFFVVVPEKLHCQSLPRHYIRCSNT